MSQAWWTNEKKIKSTLEYLEIQQNPIGTPHNILLSVKNRKYDIQKAEIKLRLITDTYMLQYHHAKFSRNKISPICKLCGEEEEDRVHFLLECKTLEENRNYVKSNVDFICFSFVHLSYQKLLMAPFIAFFHCCFFGGCSSISSGEGRLYFRSVFLISWYNLQNFLRVSQW
jgi:hypothetical protein